MTLPNGVVVLAASDEGKFGFTIAVGEELVKAKKFTAGDIARKIAAATGGRVTATGTASRSTAAGRRPGVRAGLSGPAPASGRVVRVVRVVRVRRSDPHRRSHRPRRLRHPPDRPSHI